jgi:hypothetical protein
LNPVAPVEFLVADNGHLVTIDNWHNVGYAKSPPYMTCVES